MKGFKDRNVPSAPVLPDLDTLGQRVHDAAFHERSRNTLNEGIYRDIQDLAPGVYRTTNGKYFEITRDRADYGMRPRHAVRAVDVRTALSFAELPRGVTSE